MGLLELIRGKKTHANLIACVVILIVLVLTREVSLTLGLFYFFLVSAIGTVKFAIGRIEAKLDK